MANPVFSGLKGYVLDALGDNIAVVIYIDDLKMQLEANGYIFDKNNIWRNNVLDDEKPAEMKYLRDIDVPFSSGRGWPPSDIYEDFVEKGKLDYPFKKIILDGFGGYAVTQYYRDSRIPPWVKD